MPGADEAAPGPGGPGRPGMEGSGVLRLHGIRHGVFPAIESLNPRFVAGASKLCLTVDTEREPRVPEDVLVERLLAAFPGLARHECRAHEGPTLRPAPGTAIQLARDEPSANPAHLLEHLVIELLAAFEPRRLRSGVTCAWVDPPERNDVFVECERELAGTAAVTLAAGALDAALAGRPLAPLYADLLSVWTALVRRPTSPSSRHGLARAAGLPRERVERALKMLTGSRLVAIEPLTVNLSREPHYRAC